MMIMTSEIFLAEIYPVVLNNINSRNFKKGSFGRLLSLLKYVKWFKVMMLFGLLLELGLFCSYPENLLIRYF